MYDQCVHMMCVCCSSGTGSAPQASGPLKRKRKRERDHVCERLKERERGHGALHSDSVPTDRQWDEDLEASHLPPPNSPPVLGVSNRATRQNNVVSLFWPVILSYFFTLLLLLLY